MNQTPIKNICILRLSAIGDVLMALPAIMAIQKKHPQAKITWVVSKVEAEILKNIPKLNLIIFDKKKMLKSLLYLYKTLNGVDLLLHMQPTLRANIISLAIRAKTKLGFAQSKEGQKWFINKKLPLLKGGLATHFVDEFMQFAKYLGCDDEIKFPNLITKQEETFATEKIKNKTLVINTCSSASFPYRNWHKDNFVTLIEKMPQDITIILVGGKTKLELETNEYIHKNTRSVLNLTGKTTLMESVAIIKHASVLLSVDSAPVHIADCVRTPVVSLFGATNPKQTGSYFYPQHCISAYPENLSFGIRVKNHEVMAKIKPQQVLDKILTLV